MTYSPIAQFLLLLYFLPFTSSSYVIVNLDSRTSGSMFTEVSFGLQSFMVNNHVADYEIESYSPVYKEPYEFEKKAKGSMLLDEAYAVIINTMKFYDDGKEMENYEVTSYIGGDIIPYNYYSGHSSLGESIIDCSYVNLSPQYINKSLTFKAKSVVNSKKHNFAIDDNDNMIIFEIDNTTMEIKDVEKFSKYYTDTSIDNLSIKKLFFPKPLYTSESFQLLCAVLANGTILTFKVIDNENTTLSLSLENKFNLDTETQTITQITYNTEYYFISSSQGLYKYSRNGKELTTIVSSLPIKDIIINKNTIYALTAYGMHIYEIGSTSFSLTPYLSHNYLEKFDYVSYENDDPESTYFVGVVVDNHPFAMIPEVLIEFIANGDLEKAPKVNKVFTTHSSISIQDIATDPKTYYSYIYDRENRNLYVITRSIPNFQDSFNYVINLSKDIIGEVSDSDYLSFVSFEDNVDEQILTIQTKSTLHLVGRVSRTTQALSCEFKDIGKFVQTFTIGTDCSKLNEDGTYELKGCEQVWNYSVIIKAEKRKLAGLWLFIAVLIVAVIAVIAGTIYCVFRKKNKSTTVKEVQIQEGSYQNESNQKENYQKQGAEMVEINIDNKI